MGILRTNEISGLETPTAVTGSVLLGGPSSGDYLDLSSPEFAIGNADFTIETWYNLASYPTNYYIFDLHTSGNGIRFTFYDGGTAGQVKTYWTTSTGTSYSSAVNEFTEINRWYHMSMTRKGTTVYAFMDGILQGTFTVADNFAHTNLRIGSYGFGASQGWDGYISNFRILKGTALYTENFTPPVHELQPIGDTVLLCCNNPDSAGAVTSYANVGITTTSKNITVNGDAAASTVSPGLTRDFTFGTQFQGVAKFDTQGYFVPPSGTTEQRGRGRGILYGGYRYNPNANQKIIESIQISSSGNAQKFGDIDVVRYGAAGVSSPTRGVFFGGADPGTSDIDFITIATEGNPVEFGSATTSFRNGSGVSNGVRGIVGGKFTPSTVGTIDYITIAALGDAQDFGDLSETRHSPAAASSNTRGVFAGGGPTATNTIDYVTIATVGGTAQDFGDLTVPRQALSCSSISNGIRGVFGGGTEPDASNVIDYITIATLGNAQDFGDLSVARGSLSGLSDKVRGIFAGGYTPGPNTSINTIEYITIASTGNTQDFGDMSIRRALVASCSDSHGGLS